MVAISIIIPVYKAERYLCRCLDSIINQSFKDFEVILVDDGSPDSSGSICDKYAQKDNRFKVIHKINGGLPSARACGTEQVTGKYVIQIDPDDWCEHNMLLLLYEKALEDDADIVICDFYKDFEHSSKIVRHDHNLNNKELLFDEFLTGRMQASFWNKLIRYALYEKCRIRYNLELTRWEDVYVICSLMACTDKISFVSVPLYHYDLYTNHNSLIRKPDEKGLKSQIIVCEYFYAKYKGTVHEAAVDSMRKSTKELAYDVLDSPNYIMLYKQYNKEVCKRGLRGQLGISGFFHALTILINRSYPQYIYRLLSQYHR